MTSLIGAQVGRKDHIYYGRTCKVFWALSSCKISLLIMHLVIKFWLALSSVTDSNSVYAEDLHLTLSPVTQRFRPKRQSCNALRGLSECAKTGWFTFGCQHVLHLVQALCHWKVKFLSSSMKQKKKIKLCKEMSLLLINQASAQPKCLVPAANRVVGKFSSTCDCNKIN